MILRGKRVGFSLEEIKEMLDLYNLRDGQVTQLKVASVKMRERLEALRKQRLELEEAIADLERTCEIVDGMLRERQVESSESRKRAVTRRMGVLGLAKPAWMNEELDLLEATCRQFFAKECAPAL